MDDADRQLLHERSQEIRDNPPTWYSVEDVFSMIGGKWKLLILWSLVDTPRRCGELKRRIPNISEKMLIQQLGQLVRDGLVHREQYPEVPPRVVYSLTPMGDSLVPILDQLAIWGMENLEPRHSATTC